ncbi:hypothetical protein BC937DRAFT_88971 [Endogone sp. FLAS-F59071]|nr:hypothetical protein BC937DRAFT_88971 [Endogone sp. FLAS-F59071]|eukprot:RUS18272.1 hypothetical protein BC937DRAFT_88971 [Endogone sp. FLAS-F59071]
MSHSQTENTGSLENANFNHVQVHGNLANGVGHADFSTIYNFHGDQEGWKDSAQQDELFERMKKISKPDQRLRWYSREIGTDSKKKDIRVRGRNGYIPADELVHVAAGVGDCQAIDLLQSRYTASVNTKHKDGWRPIHRAAQGGQVESMNMLAGRYQVDVGERTDNKSKLALLHIAASQGRLEVIELLAGEKGPQTVKMGSLQPKVQEGQEIANPFPATEEDENTDTEENTNADTKEGNSIRFSHSGSPNPDEYAEQPPVRIIEWIPGDPNVRSYLNWTPMHFAASNDKRNVAETIRKLKAIGGNVNAKDYRNWTPLHVAARNGNWVAVQTLIEEGADVNATGNHPNNATPLCLAKLIRQHIVEKKETDKYALAMVILKNHGAKDRRVKHWGAPRLRQLLESAARKMVDDEWLTNLSEHFTKKEVFVEDIEATAIINAANIITPHAIAKRPIWWYNIVWQALVLSLFLLITFAYSVSLVYQDETYILIWNGTNYTFNDATFSITFMVTSALSIFQLVALICFSIPARRGAPSSAVALYVSLTIVCTFLWILICLYVTFESAICGNYTGLVLTWETATCSSLLTVDILAWCVLVLHVLNIVTIFKQVYKYFPPDLPEEECVKVNFVGGSVPPHGNEKHISLTPSLAITFAARAWFGKNV